MVESEATSTPEPPSKEELRLAMKAFRKRLKLTRLDDESGMGYGPTSSGQKSGIVAITPPNQFSMAVWQELAKQGKIPPIKVDGREVTIKHTSPLSRAQDQEDLMAYDMLMERMAPLGQEVTALGIKIDGLSIGLFGLGRIPDLSEGLGTLEQIVRLFLFWRLRSLRFVFLCGT